MDSPMAAFIDRTLRAEASEWRTWADGDASVGGLRRMRRAFVRPPHCCDTDD